ncbi:pilus assembly protein PilF, partial [Aphanizomenon flos-aquae CCAP 1446/1C]|nr:pilus assembly protein PilF [Anabaena sp. CCAP 1446/1C]
LRINPNLAIAYFNRGAARLQSRDKKGAIADLQKASKLFQQQGEIVQYQYILDLIQKINIDRK